MRAFLVGGFVFLCIFLCGLIDAPTIAATSEQWLGSTVKVMSRSTVSLPYDAPVCEGNEATITVAGNGTFQNACILGETSGVRIARFFSGVMNLYAVAFPGSYEFYELRGVCLMNKCAYASESDVLVQRRNITPYLYGAVIFKDFTKSLVKRFDPTKGATYFSFEPTESPYYLKAGDAWLAAEAMTVSQNGVWAAVELKGYGIVRINTKTLESRRILAQTGEYGYGYDPAYELAITNDGRYVALSGKNASLMVISVNDTCGDRLVQGMEVRFGWNIIPCLTASIETNTLFPNFAYISSPRFNATNERLGVTVRYRNNSIERAVLSTENTSAPLGGYLAFGDSFSSGEGELDDTYYQPLTNQLPFRCHTSERSYPYSVGKYWNMPTHNVACSGAKTVDIIGSGSYAGQADALLSLGAAEISALRTETLKSFRPGVHSQQNFAAAYQPEVISIGIGGNDAGLVTKLTSCLNIGTCEWVSDPAKRYATSQEIAAVYPKILETIRSIKEVSPQSRLILVGYPNIIDASSEARCSLLLSTLLNQEERIFIRETIHYLNQIVKTAASAQSIAFVDTEQSFAGKELCGRFSEAAMNSIRLGDDMAPVKQLPKAYVFGAESFHPTPMGHQLVSDTVIETYPEPSAILHCTVACEKEMDTPSPSQYWQQVGTSDTAYMRQVEATITPTSVIYQGQSYEVSTKNFLFSPGSSVRIELHSEPIQLAEGVASSNGSMGELITIPINAQIGYHSLHLIGTSPSGTPIDVYQAVVVVDKEYSGYSTPTVSEEKQSEEGVVSGSESSSDPPQYTRLLLTETPGAQPFTSADVLGVTNLLNDTVLGGSSQKAPFEHKAISTIAAPIIVGFIAAVSGGVWLFLHRHRSRDAPR